MRYKMLFLSAALAMSGCMNNTTVIEEWSANDITRNHLELVGVDISQPLVVEHWAVPPTEDYRIRAELPAQVPYREVEKLLTSKGFGVLSSSPNGIRFAHETVVKGWSFDELTHDISVELESIGWTYGGWETEHIKSES